MKTILGIFIIWNLFNLPLTTAQEKTKSNPIYPVFNLDQLAPFLPGNNLADIPKSYTPGEKVILSRALELTKFNMVHDAYVFPIWVQHFNGKVIDFYTRLPSYFLHDTFHQSLINRYGKQKNYSLKNSTALYEWEDENIKRIYSGSCTITCFPIFYSAILKNPAQIPSTYVPLFELFKDKI